MTCGSLLVIVAPPPPKASARFVALDVTDGASVAAAADVVARAGGLDVLINNAGIVGPRPQVPETTAEAWIESPRRDCALPGLTGG